MVKFQYEKDDPEIYYIKITDNTTETTGFHMHEFYELEICVEGCGETVINQTKYEVKPGSVFLLTPSDIHSYATDDIIKFKTISFIPEAIEYSVFMEMLYPMKYISAYFEKDDFDFLISVTNKLRKEQTTKQQFVKKNVSLLLSSILVELYRKNSNDEFISEYSVPYYLPIQKALYFIRSHFKEEITLNMVADYVGMIPNALSKKFTSLIGIGFKEYLTDIRLEYAKLLIKNTSESITDIAFYSGFNSLANFQKAFIKKYDVKPKSLRN